MTISHTPLSMVSIQFKQQYVDMLNSTPDERVMDNHIAKFGTCTAQICESGNMILVGRPFEKLGAGAIYVFKKKPDGSSWKLLQYITRGPNDRFGESFTVKHDGSILAAYCSEKDKTSRVDLFKCGPAAFQPITRLGATDLKRTETFVPFHVVLDINQEETKLKVTFLKSLEYEDCETIQVDLPEVLLEDTDEWLERANMGVEANGKSADRDFFNVWTSGSNNHSPMEAYWAAIAQPIPPESSNPTKPENQPTIRIIVSTEQEKLELLQASRHIHDLHDLNTDLPGANLLAHLHMAPHIIQVVGTLEQTIRVKPTPPKLRFGKGWL